ncbi:hypothetical protein QVD17_26855 [Tagetes erecta]|uniref:NB-ARC domain-containing protein n=1 Tax=Tagetes erecta TaxID=13708 RepID=A0AAD8NR72_TARER|nr:hypothetical protein QVD17_26855 [Tagetes erecta]
MVLANGKKLNYKLLYVEDKLVGIENNVAEIELWLQDPSPDAFILCIQGMGGIGKTTISKCIFNSNYIHYDATCFLANIHDTSSQPGGLLNLQKQLLLALKGEQVIWNLDEGIMKVVNALCNKKVLLVLDDITTRQQLKALLGPQRFYPGSKVIITTRHKWLLNDFKGHPKVYSINELCPHESNKLFSLYAFDRDHPIEPYIVQSQLVIDHCRGLPLALKVLGSSLKRRSIDVWEDAIRKLDAIPNLEVQNILQVSYKTIEDTKDQDLFLHVACFFVGEDKEFIVKLLAECNLYPTVGIQNLMDRCLLYIEDGRVMMHQLIIEMGREIVRQESPNEPGERTRLWNHQDSFNVLKENEGTRKVEGLVLDMQRIMEISSTSIVTMDNERKRNYDDFSGRTVLTNKGKFKVKAIEKMKNLMLLQLDYATFSGSYKKLPKKLRLLRWHGFPLKSIPIDVPLQNLVVLDLRHSKLKQVWDEFKVVKSLKILNLSYSLELIKTPNFDGLPRLESLLLKGCLSLTRVCESIGSLESLVLLDISGCTSLKNIPCLSKSLVSLKMNGCSNLGSIEQVQCLDTCLVSSHLVHVDVTNCNLFDSSFPKDWSNLFSLRALSISKNHITSLPDCVKSLPALEELYVNNCSHLQSVLDVPKSVKLLSIYENMSLEIVKPPSISSRFVCVGSKKMRAIEGFLKHESVKNVDKKVVRYLGLESILENTNIDDSIKVLYEVGIFSTWVSGIKLPSFMYKESGSEISFRVPSHPNGSRVSAVNVCITFTPSAQVPLMNESHDELDDGIYLFTVIINNKTKDLVWNYTPTVERDIKGCDSYIWLSLWRTGNLLDDGDEIVISSSIIRVVVEEYCVNLVYDDDEVGEEIDEEKKEKHCFFNNHISWNDRLIVEVSDYVQNGKNYHFHNHYTDGIDGNNVDWWGLSLCEMSRE